VSTHSSIARRSLASPAAPCAPGDPGVLSPPAPPARAPHRTPHRALLGAGAALLTPLLLFAFLALLLTPTPAAGATIRTVCVSGADYTTIQAAVNASGPGDIISICGITFFENVNLSAMAVPGDITLIGPLPIPGDSLSMPAAIFPTTGSALRIEADFPGSITLAHIATSSGDGIAVNFSNTITGSLYITGGSAIQAASTGLFALAVEGTISISGTTFSMNSGPGAILNRSSSAPCPLEVPAPPVIYLSNIRVGANKAVGLSATAFGGSILVEDSAAFYNSNDGLALTAYDNCGSQVVVRNSESHHNGDAAASSGNGITLYTANAIVHNTSARENVCDGIQQIPPSFGLAAAEHPTAPRAVGNGAGCGTFDPQSAPAAVSPAGGFLPSRTVEISNTTAATNGNHGINVGAVDFVTITAVSALSNTLDGIRLPYMPQFFPTTSAANGMRPAGFGSAGMLAAIADSLIVSNGVGIELNHQIFQPPPIAAAPAPGGPAATISGNIVCANTRAGLALTGNVSQTVSATPNYWGSFTGPRHAVKNPGGAGNQVVDAANPSTFPDATGDALFAPFVDGSQAIVSPPVGVVGRPVTLNVAFTAGPLGGLTGGPNGGPGNPAGGPLFTVAAGSGVLTTAFGSGLSAPAAIVDGVLTATVVATAPGPIALTVTGPCGLAAVAGVTALQPAVTVTKTAGLDPHVCAPAGPVTVPISSSLYYCVSIANTGNITLTHHLVSDPQLGIAAPLTYTLPPGASVAVTRSLVAGLGPVVVTGSLTNAVAISSTAVLTEFGGLPVEPTVTVSAQTAGAVRVIAQPTGSDEGPEPAAPPQLYLPTLTR
jgi:hypothetical protein